MDSDSTPFIGKSQPLKHKSMKKPSKPISKDPPISRPKRVFGTARSTNVPAKIIIEKPTPKPSAHVPQKQPKSNTKTQSPPVPKTKVVENNADDKSEPELKKEEVCFQGTEPQDTAIKTITEKPTANPDTKTQSPPKLESKVVENNAEDKSEPESNKKEDCIDGTKPQDLPAKTITEDPTFEPSFFPQKQPKPVAKSQTPIETKVVASSSEEKTGPKLKKKGVCFQVTKPKVIGSESEEVAVPRTPVASPSVVKTRRSGTPYRTAQNCSKCRFDRLETASHWLGQIRLAESVGKHFVSVALFRLAHECKAEPIRSIRIEVKRYLNRHGHLSAAPEWKEVSLCYGLLKNDVHMGTGGGLDHGKASNITTGCTRGGDIDDDLRGIEISLEENPIQDPEAET